MRLAAHHFGEVPAQWGAAGLHPVINTTASGPYLSKCLFPVNVSSHLGAGLSACMPYRIRACVSSHQSHTFPACMLLIASGDPPLSAVTKAPPYPPACSGLPQVTLLFADIVGFTEMCQQVGAHAA